MKVVRWKHIILALCAFVMIPGCFGQDFHSLAATISQQISASGRRSVAVTDFTDLDGNPTELGRYLAEEFSDALFPDAKGFDVIDRTHLKAILQEHNLAEKGLIDPSTARQLGKVAGVETLVTGTITPFQDYVRLSIKVIDTESAKILAASTYDVPRTKTISELIAQSGAASDPGSGSASSDVSPKSQPTVSFGDFSISMVGCKIQGAKVLCYGHITNESSGAERLSFQPSSYMVDDSGNVSKSDARYTMYRMTIQVGSDRSQFGCCLDTTLEPKLPLNIWFWGIDLSMTTPTVSIVLNTSVGNTIIRGVRVEHK